MSEISNGASLADVAAVMNGGNGGANNWMNNPFMYLIWLAWMGNNGGMFGGNSAQAQQNIETSSRIDALSQQIADNQQTNTLAGVINSNHDYLHDLGGNINLGFTNETAAINSAAMGNTIGQKDLQQQMATGCCDIKSNILQQTNMLQQGINGVQNSIMNAASQLGFLTQQQTNELSNVSNAGTQKIVDTLNNHWNAELSQELQNAKFEQSQLKQNVYLGGLINNGTAGGSIW